MTSEAANVVVHDLHKAFGSQAVLTGLDLEVPAGSFTAILGPSGSGKTTLLRILAGFEQPDRGSVTIGDVTVDDDHHHVPAERRRIGYVSQEGSLFPHLNVEANVTFGLPRPQRRGPQVRDLLDAVGLVDLARRYPHQLSGGQQQRVALARALAVGPRIVLLDEPFASLDAQLRAAVRTDVQTILREAGMTAILVTHDQEEALSIADLVAVIRRGKIAQVATPLDLYTHPVNSDLARFVGEANLIDGIVRGDLVDTPFGAITVRDAPHATAGKSVTVLVRPEQFEVHADLGEEGVPGRIASVSFHGRDALIHVAIDPSYGSSPIIARVLGGLQVTPGSDVILSVRGPVVTWPRAEVASGPRPTELLE